MGKVRLIDSKRKLNAWQRYLAFFSVIWLVIICLFVWIFIQYGLKDEVSKALGRQTRGTLYHGLRDIKGKNGIITDKEEKWIGETATRVESGEITYDDAVDTLLLKTDKAIDLSDLKRSMNLLHFKGINRKIALAIRNGALVWFFSCLSLYVIGSSRK